MTITLRLVKGSPLTWAELDGNFTDLVGRVVSVKDDNGGGAAVGDGVADDTLALQAALNLMAGSTDSIGVNRAIELPTGIYRVTSTLTSPNSASYFKIYGPAAQAAAIRWDGAAGSPVLKLTNARGVVLEDFSIHGKVGARPNYLVQSHRAAGGVGAGAPGLNRFVRLRLGSGTGNDHDVGIGYTADAGQDSNNEQMWSEDVEINNSNLDCYAFLHANSLLHKIVGGSCGGYLRSAINTYNAANTNGASFSVFGTSFGGGTAAATIFNIMQPLHSIEVHGAHHEGTGKFLLKTNGTWNTPQGITFHGGTFVMTDVGAGEYTVDFNADNGYIGWYGVRMAAAAALVHQYQGAGARVVAIGGDWAISELRYACEVALHDVRQEAGAPTYTNLGGGFLKLNRSAGASVLNTTPQISGNLTSISVDALPAGTIIVNNAAPTNLSLLTDGYVGQVVVLQPSNGNTTIVHTAGTTTNAIKTKTAANVTLGANVTITLKLTQEFSAGHLQWFEI